MIFFYESILKTLKLILNLVFLIQIILLILIFLTAAYWFFNLIDSSLFNFAAPLANSISAYVKTLYTHDIMLDGVYIDGSLLLFDIVMAVFIVFITKLKFFINKFIDNLNYRIISTNKQNEKKQNEELEKSAEELIRQYRKAAFVIEFSVRNIDMDSVWSKNPDAGVKEKTEELLRIFYATMKSLPYCRFAKTDNRLAVFVEDFDNVDNTMVYIEQSIKRLKANSKKQGWELITYTAADVFYDNTDFKKEVYPSMEKLLRLKHKNEMICYGNFNLRYNLVHEPMYYLILGKGDYVLQDMPDAVNIFTIVKKN